MTADERARALCHELRLVKNDYRGGGPGPLVPIPSAVALLAKALADVRINALEHAARACLNANEPNAPCALDAAAARIRALGKVP